MSWHVDASLLRRYLAGDTDLAAALSIEAHVSGCGACRGLLPDDPAWLGDSWSGVADRVIVAQRGPMERLLVRVGVGTPSARLLAATPSLRRSWWAAVVAALAFTVAAAHAAAGDDRGLLLFLALAPLLPVAGVAVAYGPHVDPVHELTVGAPMSGLRLLLIRAVAVLCTTVGLALLALPLLPALSWTAAGWLLPALALTTVSLVLGSWLSPVRASAAVTAVWLGLVALVAVPGADALLLFRAGAQAWFAVLLGAAGALLVARRGSFDVGGGR